MSEEISTGTPERKVSDGVPDFSHTRIPDRGPKLNDHEGKLRKERTALNLTRRKEPKYSSLALRAAKTIGPRPDPR
jgi:hypothetical protein